MGLSHIRLVVAVEEMFSIRFDASDVVELENVGQFVDLIDPNQTPDELSTPRDLVQAEPRWHTQI